MNLSELHDCEKSHNKLVMIESDYLGVQKCGYCHMVVRYGDWLRKELGEKLRKMEMEM